jgi:CheY-like chemotaxis protein
MVLRRHGYQVLEAEQGVAALRVWNEHSGTIDLLLTDLVMPDGIGGMELAARLRERSGQLRVIFTSGYNADISGRELSLQSGQLFIQKPASPALLLETVRRCLDG